MRKINKMNGMIFLVLILLLVSLPLHAGDGARIGTAAGVQVQVPVGARDLAMGGADIVYTHGVDAIFWNPAGLSSMENSATGTFSTVTIFNDIKVNYLALGVKMGSLGHLGFSIKAFDFGDIPVTTVEDMDGTSGMTFSPTFSTIAMTYANKLTSTIQVGATAKMIYEEIPRASATAFAFDIGIQYRNLAGLEGVSFGVVARNIGTNMTYSGSGLLTKVDDPTSSDQEYMSREAANNHLPASLDLGLSYKYQVMANNDLIVSGVFQNNNVENDAFRFGLEYNYNNFVALRAGYNYVTNTDSKDQLYDFTVGAGLQYQIGGATFGLDYAFRNSQYFNANNMFSLRVAF